MTKQLHLLLLTVLLLSGCTTLRSDRRGQALRRDNDLNALKARVAKLENRVNDIEGARQRLYEENDALRAAVRKDSERLREELVHIASEAGRPGRGQRGLLFRVECPTSIRRIDDSRLQVVRPITGRASHDMSRLAGTRPKCRVATCIRL